EAEIRLKAVGLDVTTIPQLEIVKKDYARIRRSKGKISMFATRILESNIRAHGRFTLHDPMTVAVKIRPSFYRFSDCRVAIETKRQYTTGLTVAERRDLKEEVLLRRRGMVSRDVVT